jgi:hypothetical protein
VFQTGLFDFLKNQSTLTAVLGTTRKDLSTGIWALLASNEPTLPYLTFRQMSNKQVMSMNGANRLQMASYRFSCYGSTYPSAQALAEALRLIFATYTGTWSDGTIIQNIQLENAADDSESVPHGTIYAVHLDYEFCYLDMS